MKWFSSFPYWILFFFKKNEEVIWPVHLLTYLLKLGERAPQYFYDFCEENTEESPLNKMNEKVIIKFIVYHS